MPPLSHRRLSTKCSIYFLLDSLVGNIKNLSQASSSFASASNHSSSRVIMNRIFKSLKQNYNGYH